MRSAGRAIGLTLLGRVVARQNRRTVRTVAAHRPTARRLCYGGYRLSPEPWSAYDRCHEPHYVRSTSLRSRFLVACLRNAPAQDRLTYRPAQVWDVRRENTTIIEALRFEGDSVLRALRVENIIGLGNRTSVVKLHVRSGWDDIKGEIGPKSEKGERYVPVPETLRALLAQHLLRTGRKERDLVFGKTATAPFVPCTIGDHATKAWTKARLEPIGLHEARHTYVSVMHAAGLSLEQIGDYVGHSSSYMTDRYRHLLDGHEQEAAERFEQYLAGAHTGAQRR